MDNFDAVSEGAVVNDPVEPLESDSQSEIPLAFVKLLTESNMGERLVVLFVILKSPNLCINALSEQKLCGRVQSQAEEYCLEVHHTRPPVCANTYGLHCILYVSFFEIEVTDLVSGAELWSHMRTGAFPSFAIYCKLK
jgi:hypothetical protein